MAINVLNSAADLASAELLTADDVQDISGLKTFVRAPAPPFGVEAGSAKVTNLDADQLDGQEGAFYRDASNLNAGTISGDRFPDPLPAVSGQNLSNLTADALVTGIVTVPTFTSLANTAVGAQNNWAPGVVGNTVVFWNGASDLVLSGLAGGVLGQLFILHNITSAKVAYLIHQSGLSSAGNKFRNIATSGNTPVAAGGTAVFQYDGTDWQLIQHEQGAWITPAFAAGDYTAPPTTWTLAAGDVSAQAWRLSGRTMTVAFLLLTTSVGAGTAGELLIGNAAWGGFVATKPMREPFAYNDNGGAETIGMARVVAAGVAVALRRIAGANWSAATNTTELQGRITFEVD